MNHSANPNAKISKKIKSIDPIYQGEVSECGLACIAMLLQALGIDKSLSELRESNEASLRGISLYGLVDILATQGVKAAPVRFSHEALRELPLPAILHVGGNHYVLVMRAAGNLFHVYDPATGAHLVHIGILGGMASGYAVILENEGIKTPPSSHKKYKKDQLAIFLSNAGGFRLVMLTLVGGALSFLTPLFVGYTINALIGAGNQYTYWTIGGAFLLASLGGFLFERFSERALLRKSVSSAIPALERSFSKLISNRLRYFSRRAPGDLVERFASYGDSVVEKTRINNTIFSAIIISILGIGIMIWLQPLLALVSVTGLAISGLLTYRYATQTQSIRLQAELAAASKNQFLLETVQGITAWKSAFTFNRRVHAYLEHGHNMVKVWHQQSDLGLRQRTAYMLLSNLELLVMLGVAGSAVAAGTLTFGGFYAFTFVRQIALYTASQGYGAWMSALALRVVESRASDMFENSGDSHQKIKKPLQISLHIKGLGFQHIESSLFLRDINLEITRGEKIAITGASGSGKSTLLALLAGLEHPQVGSLWVDGEPLNDWESLRGHCYLHTAHDILFSGSILENLTMFNPHPNKSACWHLIEKIGLEDRVRQMPAGIETKVTDATISLSAGERQRLLVARALQCSQSICMFDEPTANLDADSARLIIAAITEAPHAAIVVTHDLADLNLFDTVYTLQDGCLHKVSDGNPSEKLGTQK